MNFQRFTVLRDDTAPDGGGGGGGEGPSLIPAAGAPPATTPAGGAPPANANAGPPWWNGILKDDGKIDVSKFDKLPDELKDSQAILKRYGTIEDVYKGLAHHARTAREKGLVPLRDGASEAEVADHLERLAKINGRPDTPEGYGLKRPDNVPEDQWDQGFVDGMAKVFHKHALSPAAVKEIFATYDRATNAKLEELQAEAAQQDEARFQAQQQKLKLEFGAFAQEKFHAAVRGARWMGIDPNSPLFKTNADLIIAAAKVGAEIEEAKFVDGGAAATFGADPEAEMQAMVSDPTHKFYDVLRNPGKNPRLYQEALAFQVRLSTAIAAKRARQMGAPA